MKFSLFLWALLAPQIASAHLVSARFGEFYAGAMHPVISLEHLLPWLALGLLAGAQSPRYSRLVLVLFPLAVIIGALLGSSVLIMADSTWVHWCNLSSFFILGLLLVLARPLPFSVFLSLVGLYGLSHGMGNSASYLVGGDLMLYVLGVGLVAYVLTALFSAISQKIIHFKPWGLTVVRALGSWITAIGLMNVAFLLTNP